MRLLFIYLCLSVACNAQVVLKGTQVLTGPQSIQAPKFTLLQDLVAYWPLEEASGTREDSVSNNDLTDNNTVTQTTGKVGNCAVFTKANSESLTIADNASLSIGVNQSFTIAGWVYLTTITTGDVILGKALNGVNLEYKLFLNSSKATFYASSAGDGTEDGAGENTTTLSTETWYFFVMWYDASDDKFYVSIDNDTDYNFIANTIGVADDTGDFALGKWGSLANYLNGRLDEVGVWKRTLAPDEITYLYNSGSGRTYPFN